MPKHTHYTLSTDIKELDEVLGSLNPSDFLILAARPGMGKSVFALKIGESVARNSNKDVVIFDLEASVEKRITCSPTSNELTNTDIHNEISLAEIKDKCQQSDNLGLIIIDYLQLFQGLNREKNDANRNLVKNISELSLELKNMAKQLNLPILCISQLPRAVDYRADKRPTLQDLREIGSIGQDADIVMFLYRESYYNTETELDNTLECIVAKNRHGSIGTVKLQHPRYTAI